MTDTSFSTNGPPGASDAGPVVNQAAWANASEHERGAYREALISKYGATATEAALANIATPAAGGTPVDVANFNSTPAREGLSGDQAIAAADELFKHASARIRAEGKKSNLSDTLIQQQVDEYSAKLQATMDRDYGIVQVEEGPELRTEAEIQFDEAFAPPDGPSEYQLQFHPTRLEGVDIGEARALREEFAGAFHAMRLPAANAQTMMDAFLDTMSKFETTPADKRHDNWSQERMAIERNLSPGHSWADVQKYVQLAVGKIPAGPFKQELLANGSFESASVVIQLYRQGMKIERKSELVAQRAKK